MIKQVRAVAAAHLGMNAGLPTLLLITFGWAVVIALAPSAFITVSIWYAAAVAMCMGIGLRLHLFSYRAYLVPGFRAAQGIFALGVLVPLLLVVSFARPPDMSISLWVALLWLCCLAVLYWIGLSRTPVVVFIYLLFVVLLFPRSRLQAYLPAGFLGSLEANVGLLLAANAVLTVLAWRQTRELRGKRPIEPPGAGFRGFFTSLRIRAEGSTSSDGTGAMPASFFRQIRYFSQASQSGSTGFLRMALSVMILMLVTRFALQAGTFTNMAFTIPLLVPVLTGGSPQKVRQRMFMLPLNRSEIVNRWIGGLFYSVLKLWSACALPVGLVVLVAGWGSATPTSLAAWLAATLAAQLPLFGVATMLHTFKTQTGTAILFLVLIPISTMAGDFMRTHQSNTWAVILGSMLVGPMLIWFSYRRWCNLEVG